MKRDIQVYTASVWFRDGSLNTRVVAVTPELAQQAIQSAIGAETGATWSAIHPASLRTVLSDALDTRELVKDLRDSGNSYANTY